MAEQTPQTALEIIREYGRALREDWKTSQARARAAGEARFPDIDKPFQPLMPDNDIENVRYWMNEHRNGSK